MDDHEFGTRPEDSDLDGLLQRLEDIGPEHSTTSVIARCAALSIAVELARLKMALRGAIITPSDVIEMAERLLAMAEDRDSVGLNQARVSAGVLGTGPFEWNKLKFRSPGEVSIAEALSQEEVMFFPMAAAVAGVKKREPDFLVVSGGRWGILEVQGKTYHPPETAAEEHNRARWFKKYGIRHIEFYDHQHCQSDPQGVVSEFLELLRTS